MKKLLLITIAALFCLTAISQTYPTFGPEKPVTISGLTFDAMEPFLSADGNYMFFNSLNDGVNTSLYYASRVNDTTFTLVAQVNGVNYPAPHLDAVASMDSLNNFYWVTTRNYPNTMDNFCHGAFNAGNVTDTGRVHGNFYIYSPGWLIMDATINHGGNLLYYCNAYFNNCNIPCWSTMGIAVKITDTTFAKLPSSDTNLQLVNDTNYINYAPAITKDELELYFTRVLRSNPSQSEICVAVRSNASANFSAPSVIYASALIPEGPTLTADKTKMYYHKKDGALYKLFLRYRTTITNIEETENEIVAVCPNPSNNIITITPALKNEDFFVDIYSLQGQKLLTSQKTTVIDISTLAPGVYTVVVKQKNKHWKNKIVKYQ
jgi:hypothetical protein